LGKERKLTRKRAGMAHRLVGGELKVGDGYSQRRGKKESSALKKLRVQGWETDPAAVKKGEPARKK